MDYGTALDKKWNTDPEKPDGSDFGIDRHIVYISEDTLQRLGDRVNLLSDVHFVTISRQEEPDSLRQGTNQV